MVFVYVSFLLVVGMGTGLTNRVKVFTVAGTAISASVIFFIITNFGVWITMNMYPKSIAGLMECYAAALPFFRNTLLGDLAYTAIIFGAFESVLAMRPKWKTLPSHIVESQVWHFDR